MHRVFWIVAVTLLALCTPLIGQAQVEDSTPLIGQAQVEDSTPGSIWIVTVGSEGVQPMRPAPSGDARDSWEEGTTLRFEAGPGEWWNRLQVSKLTAGITELAAELCDMMAPLEDVFGGYAVDQVEINLTISADGSIGILGTGGRIGTTGGIKLVLQRQ